MTQNSNNTINLPGYLSNVSYGDNQNEDYITQHNAQCSIDGIEITFYNDDRDTSYTCPSTLVAIWHIKERKQLA